MDIILYYSIFKWDHYHHYPGGVEHNLHLKPPARSKHKPVEFSRLRRPT